MDETEPNSSETIQDNKVVRGMCFSIGIRIQTDCFQFIYFLDIVIQNFPTGTDLVPQKDGGQVIGINGIRKSHFYSFLQFIAIMATKRKSIHSTSTAGSNRMNFRPGGIDVSRSEARGTRPTARPTTVREVLVTMLMHLCKKSIFFNTDLKVALYLGALFIVSVIGDFVPFPRSYFSRSDNLFNVYFVKMGWAWTLTLMGPFLFMTSYTLCCGNSQKFLKHHLPRIFIATMFWWSWTKFFNIIETAYGRCNSSKYDSRSSCLKAGFVWSGFDISGHTFILIYSSLVLIEEARPIVNWETIRELLRNEEYNRSVQNAGETNPLRNLKDNELRILKILYTRYTPAIRILFVGITVLQLLWDIMLVCTMLYYHRMIEKVLSGIFAILTWFFTYRAWYASNKLLPDLPGTGLFAYQKPKVTSNGPIRRRGSLVIPTTPSSSNNTSRGVPSDVPKFMGMPLYAAYQQQPSAAASNSKFGGNS